MKRLKYDEWVPGLAQAVPALAPLLSEHIAFYKEILPHVFMYDVALETVAALHSVDRGQALALSAGDARAVLQIAEDAMAASDPEVTNVVQISFLDNLMKFEVPLADILREVGPECRKYLLANYH